MRAIRIATRKSRLALWQANHVRDRLLECRENLQVELLEIVSEGDRTLDVPLAEAGGKGLFLKELEQALLGGQADLAVHSIKDMTVTLPDGLALAAVCQRDDPRDAFVSNRFDAIARLPRGAVVGTCSLRRQCQLRARFPHLRFANLRGNVNTRLEKLDRGEFDGIVLAVAGLKRLQLAHRITEYLSAEICLPAAGQGAIGIECRLDDADTRELIAPLDHADSATRIAAERAVSQRLGGSCHLPLAAYSELHAGGITVRALIGNPDGSKILRSERSGDRRDAVSLGQAAADCLLARGAGDILAKFHGT